MLGDYAWTCDWASPFSYILVLIMLLLWNVCACNKDRFLLIIRLCSACILAVVFFQFLPYFQILKEIKLKVLESTGQRWNQDTLWTMTQTRGKDLQTAQTDRNHPATKGHCITKPWKSKGTQPHLNSITVITQKHLTILHRCCSVEFACSPCVHWGSGRVQNHSS